MTEFAIIISVANIFTVPLISKVNPHIPINYSSAVCHEVPPTIF